MPTSHPYHEGERAVQARADTLDLAERHGRIIDDTIAVGAHRFIAAAGFVAVGSVDADDRVWASVLLGLPGFVTSHPNALEIDLSRARRDHPDPLWRNLADTGRLGLLFIDFATRRRYRVNGAVAEMTSSALRIEVQQAYANCPKYIHPHHVPPSPAQRGPGFAVRSGSEPQEDVFAWIAGADTCFVASQHPEGGVDVSHRGGPRGFVERRGAATLRIPDFPGNGMFNTLGNLAVCPRAGLVFFDFERGASLQLCGTAELVFDASPEATLGTARAWDFRIERFVSPRSFGSPPPQGSDALPGTLDGDEAEGFTSDPSQP